MNRTHIILLVAGAVALTTFYVGRRVEGTRQPHDEQEIVVASPTAKIAPENSSAIFIKDISTVPFADLYDVLRSATVENRAEWARELEALPAGPTRNAALSGFFKTLVQLDAEEAIDLVEKLHDRGIRQIASDAMFRAAPTAAMPAMAKFFLRTPYRATGIQEHLDDAIEEWSLVDPTAVSRFFDENPGSEDLQGCFHTLLFQWAKLDPESARNWFQRQKPFPETEEGKRNLSYAVHGFVFGWYNKDRSAALDFAISNAANEAFGEVIHDLATSLFLKSEDDAAKFIERIPDSSLKAKTLESLVTYTTTGVILGYQDPADKRSAETMTKWMVSLPEEAWADQIGSVADLWKRDDPLGFSAWLGQQPVHTKDRIIYDWCASGDSENPKQVLAQAASIGDAELREKALVTYALALGTTPDESIKFLRKSDLSNEQKAYLFGLIRRSKRDHEQ